MRQLRSSTSPQKSPKIDISDFSTSSRALRSASRGYAEVNAGPFDRETRPGLKRSWSWFSTHSISSAPGGAPWYTVSPVKNRCSESEYFQLLTPAASPSRSLRRSTDKKDDVVSFLDMPIEVHQHICEHLAEDKDLVSYAMLCLQTNRYVNSSVWRKQFESRFDINKDASSIETVVQYKERRGFEHIYVDFDDGPHPLHARFLSMLKDVILQSDARMIADIKGKSMFSGRNHEWIRRSMADEEACRTRSPGTNLVDAICSVDALFPKTGPKKHRSTNSLVLIVQLCLLHLALDPKVCLARPPQFIESQHQVYKCVRNEPIFIGKNKGDINFSWLLHVANFFKFHFKAKDGEGLLAHVYDGLDKSELPRPWCGKLRGGTQELGKSWKGTFTFLGDEDLQDLRAGEGEAAVDEFQQDNDGFQDLTLFFDIQGNPDLEFGPKLENELHGMPHRRLRNNYKGDKSSPEVKDFVGLGYNGERYHFKGRLHALPPQEGIPGFQRITMLKYLPDDAGNYGRGRSSRWGYEGCVLPGNQIMLGRWWRAYMSDEPFYSGPFIFWAVEGSAEDKRKDITDVVSFLDYVNERTIHP